MFKKNLPLLKLLIGIVGFTIIYFQLKNKFSLNDFVLIKDRLSQFQGLILFMLCCCLMPINWLTESLKWHYLVNKISNYTFFQSIKATLAGVYFGNFLPYRLGDLGGRLVYLNKADIMQGLMLYTAGGIAQIYITLLGGAWPLLLALPVLKIAAPNYLILLMTGLLLILFPYIIKQLPKLFKVLQKLKWLKNLSRPEVYQLNNTALFQVLLLSCFRYSIYLSQFVILCVVFGVDYSIDSLYQKSALMFLLFAFVPSFLATEWLTRVGLALLVFGNTYGFAVTVAASMLWLINILLPSLLGYLIILTYRLKPVNLSK